MKTIINVWTQYYVNTNLFYGIGDMIRGTLKLYQLCKKLNYNFLVDISLHPISYILKDIENPYKELILQNKNNIIFLNTYDLLIEYINTHNYEDIIFFGTNVYCDENLTIDTKNFIKKLLQPNNKYEEYLNLLKKSIPYTNYNILHFRLGDDQLVYNLNNVINNNLINIITNNIESNDILLSDSIQFKAFINKNYNIFLFKTKPCHIGTCSKSIKIKEYYLYKTKSCYIETCSKSNTNKIYHPLQFKSSKINIIKIKYNKSLSKLMNPENNPENNNSENNNPENNNSENNNPENNNPENNNPENNNPENNNSENNNSENNNSEIYIEELKSTLAEFFIIKDAKKIKTYSIYNHISGFVFWISKIYDIPLHNMKG